ncbi:MAG: alpha/beta hydrolase [Gammaproteobacteria bacterium]|nr:alpha/beta hydrolase [Gammaproteobacteria bacterium]
MSACVPRLLAVDGRQIECLSVPGDRARPTLVLLHEGLGCVAMWRDFPQRLAAATGHAVFAYSRPGYGRSSSVALPWPLDYMQREGRKGLPAVLDAAGIGDCVLFGHSDGASIALVHAGLVADPRVRGLIVLAPHVFTEAAGLASIAQARDAYVHGDLRAKLAKYHADVDGAFRGWCDSWLHPDFVRWNIEHVLPGIRVPLLQIQGEGDQYGTSAQLAAIARAVRGPCRTLLLADCRHAPQFERPGETLAATGEFLDGLAHIHTNEERRTT